MLFVSLAASSPLAARELPSSLLYVSLAASSPRRQRARPARCCSRPFRRAFCSPPASSPSSQLSVSVAVSSPLAVSELPRLSPHPLRRKLVVSVPCGELPARCQRAATDRCFLCPLRRAPRSPSASSPSSQLPVSVAASPPRALSELPQLSVVRVPCGGLPARRQRAPPALCCQRPLRRTSRSPSSRFTSLLLYVSLAACSKLPQLVVSCVAFRRLSPTCCCPCPFAAGSPLAAAKPPPAPGCLSLAASSLLAVGEFPQLVVACAPAVSDLPQLVVVCPMRRAPVHALQRFPARRPACCRCLFLLGRGCEGPPHSHAIGRLTRVELPWIEFGTRGAMKCKAPAPTPRRWTRRLWAAASGLAPLGRTGGSWRPLCHSLKSRGGFVTAHTYIAALRSSY